MLGLPHPSLGLAASSAVRLRFCGLSITQALVLVPPVRTENVLDTATATSALCPRGSGQTRMHTALLLVNRQQLAQ